MSRILFLSEFAKVRTGFRVAVGEKGQHIEFTHDYSSDETIPEIPNLKHVGTVHELRLIPKFSPEF